MFRKLLEFFGFSSAQKSCDNCCGSCDQPENRLTQLAEAERQIHAHAILPEVYQDEPAVVAEFYKQDIPPPPLRQAEEKPLKKVSKKAKTPVVAPVEKKKAKKEKAIPVVTATKTPKKKTAKK